MYYLDKIVRERDREREKPCICFAVFQPNLHFFSLLPSLCLSVSLSPLPFSLSQNRSEFQFLSFQKMVLKNLCWSSLVSPLSLFSLFFFIFTSVSASSPTYLSDGIFGNGASIGRNLLQAKKVCSVNFEFLNYTILTSQCKGPNYPPKLCCKALTDFACPYSDDLNDLTNDCATTMFSYINIHGKYPPGLFSSECQGDKEGLLCPESQSDNSSSSWIIQNPKPLLLFITGLLVLLSSFF